MVRKLCSHKGENGSTGVTGKTQKRRNRYAMIFLSILLTAAAASGCGKERAVLPDGDMPNPAISGDASPDGMGSAEPIPDSGTFGGTKPDGTDFAGTTPDSGTFGGTVSDHMGQEDKTPPDSGAFAEPLSVPTQLGVSTDLSSSISRSEPELILTPVTPLSPGEHFFLSWKTANKKQVLRIFDENWECRAVFDQVKCKISGVTDARYVEISLPKGRQEEWKLGTSGNGEPILIYDLVQNEFIDFGGKARGKVTILDDRKGYFQDGENFLYQENKGEYGKFRIIDRDGNPIVNHIDEGEEDEAWIYHFQNLYIVICNVWSEKYKYMINRTKLYDSDFNLKAIFYGDEEELPGEENRKEGVSYGMEREGAIFSTKGERLLDKERFLARFGNGEDTECSIGQGIMVENSDQNRLYPVTYAGQTWYVDTKRNAYHREGETRLTILDAKEATASYYVEDVGGETKYFAPDGSPLSEVCQIKEPSMVRMTGEESYMLFGKVTEGKHLLGYEAEMVVPEDGYHQIHRYEFLSLRDVTSLTPYTIALSGWCAEQYGEMKQELRVYKKDQPLIFRAKEVELLKGQYWDGTNEKYDNAYVVSMWDGGKQGTKKLYAYTVLVDGEVRATIPAMGQLVFCYGGYLQMDVGDEIHVYDYDGNLVIRVLDKNNIKNEQ